MQNFFEIFLNTALCSVRSRGSGINPRVPLSIIKAINSILCISDMGLSYMLSNKTIFYHFDLCNMLGWKKIWVGGKNGGSVGLQETNIFFFRPNPGTL